MSELIQVQVPNQQILFLDAQQVGIIKIIIQAGSIKNGHLSIHFDKLGNVAKVEKSEFYKPEEGEK